MRHLSARDLLPLALSAAALVACQTEAVPPPPSNIGTPQPIGGGTGNPAKHDGGSTGGACTTSSLGGSVVTQYYVDETTPPAIGGTISDGTYTLIQAYSYTGLLGQAGPTGLTLEETMTFAGTTYTDLQLVDQPDGGGETLASTSGVFSTAGNSLTLKVQCPATTTLTAPYSASGNMLHIFWTSTEELVFTLQ